MRQHLAGMRDEEAQHVELGRRQLHILAADIDAAVHEINQELARAEDRVLPLLVEAVAERGIESRHELLHAEGLGDVVVGAAQQRLDLDALIAAAREHDNGHARLLANDRDQVKAVHVRQAEIEDHQIRPLAAKEVERALGGLGLDDLIVLRRQLALEETPDGWLVIDHENGRRVLRHAGTAAPAGRSKCIDGLPLSQVVALSRSWRRRGTVLRRAPQPMWRRCSAPVRSACSDNEHGPGIKKLDRVWLREILISL